MSKRVDAKDAAWLILQDLSDRAGVPEWLGSKSNKDAQYVAAEVAEILDSLFEEIRKETK